ncbi:sodium-independent sulfate anion transporter [Folsomia candida]|uniref:sodium-independent sulfate anion transporter n=1 Tax=Folsomia candida TaxID=158441 RepID=UPI000B8EFC67|nr:sodium-independent sulfate anion transporter [Folsomia candida]XP_035709684.1 sodium-independent sulfate anion transporter [Folsomia candida]
MRTTLIHSGSSASLSSLAPPSSTQIGGYGDRISGLPSIEQSGEYDFTPQPKEENTGWLKHKFRKSNLERVFPILIWGPKYTRQKAMADLIAGVTVGLTVLPQGLAYATVAGLPPIYGLYSSFVGPFVYILFGGTKAITIGPTAIQSILTNKYTFGKPPEYAVFLCAVTAVVTMIMGVFKMGFIANYISSPVISGFTSSVAITIVATQIKALLGIHFDREGFLPTVLGLADHIEEVKVPDALLSLGCCIFLLIMKFLTKITQTCGVTNKKFLKFFWFISTSRSAIVIFATTIYVGLNYPDQPFSIVGKIPPGIPAFKPPPVTIYDPADNRTHNFLDILQEEASALLVLPLLGVMGHITIAKAFAGSSRVDSNTEVLCIGISNAISCFFSSYSIGGSFSRTTVNSFSGVESPLGGLYTGIMVLLALQFLTPYFFFIPKASLAAVITCSVIFMVDPWIILPLWRSKRMDLVPFFLTFFVTLLLGLEFGIGIGLISSTLYLLYYSARPRVQILQGETSSGRGFCLIVLDRSLTFPSVDYSTYEISKASSRYANQRTPIVIDCHHIQFADFTAAEGIRDMVLRLNENGYKIIFYKMKPSILKILIGVMHNSGAKFIHCETERKLEQLIEGYSFGKSTSTIFTEDDLKNEHISMTT